MSYLRKFKIKLILMLLFSTGVIASTYYVASIQEVRNKIFLNDDVILTVEGFLDICEDCCLDNIIEWQYIANVPEPDRLQNWCATFIYYVSSVIGYEPERGNYTARSWLNEGIRPLEPEYGDLVIFWRVSPNDWRGHIGIFHSYTAFGNIRTLGGNQNGCVNYSIYSKDRLLGFRRLYVYAD